MSSGGKWRSRYASAGDDNEDTNTKFTTTDVIESNQKLLDSIARCDYETYKELCADDITAFEPESNGMMITGLSFHKYYFDLYGSGSNSSGQQDVSKAATSETTQANDNDSNKSTTKVNICMSNPHVRWLGGGCCSDGCGDGSAAVISYVRMDQKIEDATSGPVTKISSETRVWENRDGRLVHVHFHKS